ncbi:MAG: L,D-transpeptidase [Muribaculaceae bacterium]|nr:L,D-transpeptidase [Muribaculaceae bacterium]
MTLIFSLLAALFAMPSCGTNTSGNVVEKQEPIVEMSLMDTVVTVPADTATYYSEVVNKKNCFILISKPEYRLYVCEVVDGDTLKRVHYPVCVGKNRGQKQKKGDMKTPECTAENPFTITEIVDASQWTHDFGDGRGSILSYGHWFMRLKTPGHSGIGIHGSTNNESSVPGRGSEGCIRLRDDDLIQLKENYAFVGMRVVILADE